MDDAMFQLRDGPNEQPIHRMRRVEIELPELALEAMKIKRRRNGALCYRLTSNSQLEA